MFFTNLQKTSDCIRLENVIRLYNVMGNPSLCIHVSMDIDGKSEIKMKLVENYPRQFHLPRVYDGGVIRFLFFM